MRCETQRFCDEESNASDGSMLQIMRPIAPWMVDSWTGRDTLYSAQGTALQSWVSSISISFEKYTEVYKPEAWKYTKGLLMHST